MLEYKTMTIDGRPDAILNAQSVEGWECFSIVAGAYDTHERFRQGPFGVTMFFRRDRVQSLSSGDQPARKENSTRRSKVDRM